MTQPVSEAAVVAPPASLGGVDEAGRGPLAGPVVAAVVVLSAGQSIEGVRDSKRLAASQRERLVPLIRRECIEWRLGIASAAEIDTYNILAATMLAMRRAVAALRTPPALLHVDGNRAPELPHYTGTVRTLVGGDDLCMAIGAASILAKQHRDGLMGEMDRRWPEYGFARHKGYPTRAHREALLAHGPCPEHRRSFRPVRLAAEALRA